MRKSNSELANGTSGSPQISIEQEQLKEIAEQNEVDLQRELYLREDLIKTAPIKIRP